jgi:hypothetical protein
MTNSFSKLAYKEDQEMEDMYFKDDDNVLYYLDGDLYLVDDEGYIEIKPEKNKNFIKCIMLMRRRYNWYYGEKYTNTMKFIKMNNKNMNKI